MAHESDLRLLSLHGLRLKGVAEPASVAELVQLSEDEVAETLRSLEAEGLVQHRDGRLAGYTLTRDGRAEHERLLAVELDTADARAIVTDAYKRFLDLNHDLLNVCTRWQVRDTDGGPALNDHSDAAYDAAVVAELEALHQRVRPICDELAATLARYERYTPRLEHALERVRAGEREYFTKPIMPSYHTVWFELHEDLLATLGIERSSEGAS